MCVDEKSQIQALDRSAPVLPLMPGVPARQTHDYEWVVHHVDRPTAVGFENVKYAEARSASQMADRTWHYDAPRRTLQIRVRVGAGKDSILNLTF